MYPMGEREVAGAVDTHQRSTRLEVQISQALASRTTRTVRITAAPDGTVWLRGSVRSRAEAQRISEIVGGVSGVTHVFSHIVLAS
jgi:osmotically-inducible protein OsmY